MGRIAAASRSTQKVEIPTDKGTLFDWGKIAQKALAQDDEMEKKG